MARKRTSENEIVVSPAAATAPARARKATSAAPRVRRTVAPKAPKASLPASEPVAPQAVPVVAASYQPTHDEIAQLAYSYWVARGYQGGSSEEDWLRAEQELRSR